MYLGSVGMVCSVGLSAPAACAAMRAGIAKFDELPYTNQSYQPVVGAAVPGLDFALKRSQRLVDMLALALTDCLGEKPALRLAEVPLLVGLAEPGRPAGGILAADKFVGQVQTRTGWRFHPTLSR